MRAFTISCFLVALTFAAPALGQARTSAPAAAERPDGPSMTAGWNGDWGMLFGLNNIFTSGNVLGGFRGLGTAATFFLTPTTSVRTGVTLSRDAATPAVSRIETTTGGESLVRYEITRPSYTSLFDSRARGDFVKRFTRGRVAPYAGGGLSLGYRMTSLDYEDAVSVVDQRTVVDASETRLSIGAQGILGAEWRFHSNFALFAEYELSLDVFTWRTESMRTTVENTRGGARTVSSTHSQSSAPVWMTGANSLGQGGTLGLLVFF